LDYKKIFLCFNPIKNKEMFLLEPQNGTTAKRASPNLIIILVAIIAVAASIGAALYIVSKNKGSGEEEPSNRIGYATEAKVMLDENSLQAAMDEALKNSNGNVALDYKNNAFSGNGKDFECYIRNSENNKYDMFIAIYSDAELTDQLFLSKLVPPGSGFENITLDHPLETGDHRVYVVITQVDDDEEGNQVIRNQVSHTMDFHVTD